MDRDFLHHDATSRFALHAMDGADAFAGQLPGGPHPAEVELMGAIARHAGGARIGCFAAGADVGARCAAALHALGHAGEVEWVAHGRPQDLEHFGTLLHPGAALDRLAWRRLAAGERRYSLCGQLHGSAGHDAMSAVAGLLVAPLRSWDALVCSSRTARDAVRRVLERQAAYLTARLGAQRFELPQLPLIPLGIDTAALAVDPARRAAVRARLGIGEQDVVFLFLGRLSCHAKAHPQQMFTALERADRGNRQLHLILCAPGDDEATAAAFREAAAQLCPSVRIVPLDGREPDNCSDARAAADVFTSLADNLQESFGLAPLEAMAAGLPCVVSDWDGYRDTVRDGVDGYRIPTVMPMAGAGLDLAQRYDDGVDSFDTYCGHTSQAVALDGAALALAYGRLIGDAALRRELGANASRRAREEFDWAGMFARYRALWSELDERRRADPALGPALLQAGTPPAAPDRLDPFDLFASYPSARITPASLVELTPDASLALVRDYRQLAINAFATASLPTLEEFGLIFGSIGSRPTQVDELLDALGPCDRPTLVRGLAWLCKMDLLRIVPPDLPVGEG